MDINTKIIIYDNLHMKVLPLLTTVGYALNTDNISRLEDIQGALYVAIDNLIEIMDSLKSEQLN